MLILIVAFAVSLIVTLVTVRSAKAHAHLSHDHDLSGPQKFHALPVPRIGGLGILAGALAGALVLWSRDARYGEQALLLLLCGLPALLAGLAEDLTKRVSPSRRLLATALSALLAVWLLDSAIRRTAIPGLDWVVSFPVGAALVTVFAVAGVANSVNIIDGFNGLASMCCVLILLCLAYVGFQVDDLLAECKTVAARGEEHDQDRERGEHHHVDGRAGLSARRLAQRLSGRGAQRRRAGCRAPPSPVLRYAPGTTGRVQPASPAAVADRVDAGTGNEAGWRRWPDSRHRRR